MTVVGRFLVAGLCGWFGVVVVCVGLWDAEDGYDGAGAGDADFGDEGFDQCLAGEVVAAAGDFGDVVGEAVELVGFGGDGFGLDRVGEVGTPGGELLDAFAEFGEACSDGLVVEGAVLERGEVEAPRVLCRSHAGRDSRLRVA
ncbi:MAG: hypothetical protein ACRDO7_15530 [Nocardioidaceae bacterium]